MKEKYEIMMTFIAKQDEEWKEHQKEIGIIGRFFEKVFGSNFAHNQLEEFRKFCKTPKREEV
jgi:hypothetical protein